MSAADDTHVDTLIPRKAAYNDCIENTGADRRKFTSQKFKTSLTAFCRQMGYTLNPEQLRGTDGRIRSKFGGRTEEMIYIQTKALEEYQF